MASATVANDTVLYDYKASYDGAYDDYYLYKNITTGHITQPTHNIGRGYDIVYRTVLPVVLIIGIIGIIMTVVVLSRKTMWTSTNCYLTALAVADLLFLIILSTRLLDFIDKDHHVHMFVIYFHYAKIVMNANLLASVWLTVVLAIERYTAICKPLHATIICTVKRARIVIVAIFVIAFVCRSPNFFEAYVVEESSLQIPNETQWQLAYTELFDNDTYHSVYTWLVDGILTAILPFLSLTVLNILLIYELRISTRFMRQNLVPMHEMANYVSREERKITMMLISIIVVFFILQAPYVAYNATLAIPVLNRRIMKIPGFQIFRYIAIALIAIKTAVNFALYCWFSERFWTTFKKVFCIERCMTKYHMGTRKQESNGTTGGQKYSFFASRETSL
ncbi:sex peptide receptor-related protein 2-like [Tubulanus polymorphus]|uniref:sex peptide receptor-related protein 2-like n=1 Tax=Tubulanus polymorphus TaxID=672921 RepID=UPI003DA651AF